MSGAHLRERATAHRHALRRSAATLPAALILCAAVAAGCDDGEPCGVPGVVTACACADGRAGARVCQPGKTWRDCDCSGAIALPNSVSTPASDGGADSGSGATGGTGGRSPAGGAGGAGGASGAPAPADEDDAGSEPTDAGTGGSAGASGAGGAAGDAGVVDPLDAYRECTSAAECGAGAECIVTASFPSNASVCAPACIDIGDCPVPEGSYEAVVACVTGYCRLDCTPVLFAALLTCPTGLTCIDPLFGAATCHHEGM